MYDTAQSKTIWQKLNVGENHCVTLGTIAMYFFQLWSLRLRICITLEVGFWPILGFQYLSYRFRAEPINITLVVMANVKNMLNFSESHFFLSIYEKKFAL